MDQVRRLLAEISAAGSDTTVTLSSGQLTQKQSFDKLEELLEQQGERPAVTGFEELNRNLRELTKGTQKGKTWYIQIGGHMRRKKKSENNGFNVWRSYSDMMAGVLLLFVLLICILCDSFSGSEKLQREH